MIKKLLSLMLALVMVFTMIPAVSAGSYSGTCGKNLSWSFDRSTGTMTIIGTGKMYQMPWVDFYYWNEVKRVNIGSDVTTVGLRAFGDFVALTEVTIPDSVITIESDAFVGCCSLTKVMIGSGVTTIEYGAFDLCNSLTDIYYTGTLEQMEMLAVGAGNDPFLNAEIHFVPVVEVVKFTIPGCAPNLESELEMGIAIPKASIPDGVKFTAVVTQTSGGEVVKTFEIPQDEWKNYNAANYMAYVKLAAKCMADEFSIEVIDEYGNIWNEPFSCSYRSYVAKKFDQTTDAARKSLLVDMLNYGAAAQQRFNYNVGDLANKDLTAEQQAYSLNGKVTLQNKQVMGTKNLGSTVSLESCILVYSVFKNMTDVNNMYAVVTYTDSRGNEKSVTIPGKDFEVFNASMKAYKVCVNTLVPADIDVAYTVTVYNADGTVFDTAVEGLGSYLTRNIAKDPVFGATINFGMAAKQFFVG